MEISLLEQICEPGDLVSLNASALDKLATEIRQVIIATVSKNGGHLASNLGVVELTIALHRVFNSPQDKIVWDVGHQCYTHKLLTGRYGQFSTIRLAGGLAGFPKFSESPHDAFNTGHASTSISAALGLLAGDSLQNGGNRTVAVIGDGALTGGLAYEALSHAGQLGLPLIVILNDNNMSISQNVGGLSKYLSRLSMKAKYQSFRRGFDALVKGIPLVGSRAYKGMVRMKRAVKAVFYTDNFFVDLGFEYVGPIDGHKIQQLEHILRDVRKLDHPVVVHVITQKGKGYEFAEADPGAYHGVPAFSVEAGLPVEAAFTGASANGPSIRTAPRNVAGAADGSADAPGAARPAPVPPNSGPLFTNAFSYALLELGDKNERVTAITAAMDQGTGLSPFKAAFPERFFDVGIAESHAVTFAAGLARQGLRPVVAIYSTFIPRAADQVIHDVSLQGLGVTFALDRAGFVSGDGETHQGLYDIALFRMIPNMTILAPASRSEMTAMLDFAVNASGPVMIRYPKADCPPERAAFQAPLETGRGVFIRGGISKNSASQNGVSKSGASRLCIAFTGSLYSSVMDAAERLAAVEPPDIYNLRFLKPVDEDYLAALMNRYETFAVVEEGVQSGGFGEYAATFAVRRQCAARVLTISVPDAPVSLGKRDELLRLNGLDGEGIAAFIQGRLARTDSRDNIAKTRGVLLCTSKASHHE
jgi:1-deoxy-D-xylulose-5-phosphate synthase